jgi:hypothetical protein
VVIRDANKWFVKVQSRWYDHLGDAMISEALAIRDGLGLVLAKEEGLERIIVESDNLAGASRSSLATIWFDVQELKSFFDERSIVYVNWEADGAAHCCMKFANPVDNVAA